MNSYFEPRTTSYRSLMVSLLAFGTRGPGSIPGRAPITPCYFFFYFRGWSVSYEDDHLVCYCISFEYKVFL